MNDYNITNEKPIKPERIDYS